MRRILTTIAATLAIAIVFGTTVFGPRTTPANDPKNYGVFATGASFDRGSVLGTYSIDENGDTTLT